MVFIILLGYGPQLNINLFEVMVSYYPVNKMKSQWLTGDEVLFIDEDPKIIVAQEWLVVRQLRINQEFIIQAIVLIIKNEMVVLI